jgi:HAD superfamily phosphoserine phosphatase-like hydrolase
LIQLERKTFETIVNNRPLIQGAEDVLRILAARGVKIAIVSGSFTALTDRLKEMGIPVDYALAHCELRFGSNDVLESWNLEKTDYEDKAEWVRRIGAKENIPKERRVYVGDDVNDTYAFQEVGLSIAFNSNKPTVRKSAKVVIDSRNLKSILPHLCDHDG